MSPTKTADTKVALLETAMSLLLTRGWTGFSYADLAEQVGIRKASIHYHFPTKDDLGLAIISCWHEGWDRLMDQAEATEANIPLRMKTVFDLVLKEHSEHKICPPGVLDANIETFNQPMQDAARAWAQARLNRMASWLEAGRDQGSLRYNGEAMDHAIALASGMQGAMQIERTLDNQATERFISHFMGSMQP